MAADDVKIGFNQVSLAIMPAWGGAERLAALVGRSEALLLAGSGTVLSAAEAHRIGLINRVVPRAKFDAEWRSVAQSLAHRPAGEIKRVLAGVTGGGDLRIRRPVDLRRALGRRRPGDEPGK